MTTPANPVPVNPAINPTVNPVPVKPAANLAANPAASLVANSANPMKTIGFVFFMILSACLGLMMWFQHAVRSAGDRHPAETLRESVYKFLGQRDLDSILVIGRDGAEEMIFRSSTPAPSGDSKKSDNTSLPSRDHSEGDLDESPIIAPPDESPSNASDSPEKDEVEVEKQEEPVVPVPIPNAPTNELRDKNRVPVAQVPPVVPIPEENELPTSGQHSTDCHFFQGAVWVETFQPDGMKHLGWLKICRSCRGHLHDNFYCFVGYAQDPWRPSLVSCRRIGHCNCGG